jgi:nanoRNase/pAp phosphatase (c-di-AMP/oligoRNAs hydrolase)
MQHRLLEELCETAAEAGNVLILPHNNPDPDSIASAVALECILAEQLGLESPIAHYGLIGRAENRALVSYLGCEFHSLAGLGHTGPDAVALVDTQPGAGNITLPPGTRFTIVIDHHALREETAAASFADVRPQLGATSSILVEYLQTCGVEPTPKLATALFYGIKTVTMGLARDTSPSDVAAYSYLQPRIDDQALARIEHAQVPVDYFKSLDTALRAARIFDRVILAPIGSMSYPDMAAEMADILLRLERAEWVICMGECEGNLIVSVRTRRSTGEAEQLVRAIVGRKGTAGGHGTMAGGQIRLGEVPSAVLAQQLIQHALVYLKLAPEAEGRSLIEEPAAD